MATDKTEEVMTLLSMFKQFDRRSQIEIQAFVNETMKIETAKISRTESSQTRPPKNGSPRDRNETPPQTGDCSDARNSQFPCKQIHVTRMATDKMEEVMNIYKMFK